MKHHVTFDIEFRKNTYPGRLFAFEGIDGSGKTTQAHAVLEELKKQGESVFYTKEPTDSQTGQFIRKILQGELTVPPAALQHLFVADRAVHQEIVEEKLKQGITVVMDRYFWSSICYGLVDKEIEISLGSDYNADATRLLTAYSILSMYHQYLVPDATFYLRVSLETSRKRIEQKGSHELYEKAQLLERALASYEWLANNFKEEITVIDGEADIDSVAKNVIQKIKT